MTVSKRFERLELSSFLLIMIMAASFLPAIVLAQPDQAPADVSTIEAKPIGEGEVNVIAIPNRGQNKKAKFIASGCNVTLVQILGGNPALCGERVKYHATVDEGTDDGNFTWSAKVTSPSGIPDLQVHTEPNPPQRQSGSGNPYFQNGTFSAIPQGASISLAVSYPRCREPKIVPISVNSKKSAFGIGVRLNDVPTGDFGGPISPYPEIRVCASALLADISEEAGCAALSAVTMTATLLPTGKTLGSASSQDLTSTGGTVCQTVFPNQLGSLTSGQRLVIEFRIRATSGEDSAQNLQSRTLSVEVHVP